MRRMIEKKRRQRNGKLVFDVIISRYCDYSVLFAPELFTSIVYGVLLRPVSRVKTKKISRLQSLIHLFKNRDTIYQLGGISFYVCFENRKRIWSLLLRLHKVVIFKKLLRLVANEKKLPLFYT